MTAPSPRTPVRPARGYYAVLLYNLAGVDEGELLYAKDQNTLYVKEEGALVPVLGNGSAPSNSVVPGSNITQLVNNAGYLTLDTLPEDRVQSVNGQVGVVVIESDDIQTAGNANKFILQSDLNKLAGIEAGAQVNEVEEAPLDGNFYVRQNGQWVNLQAALDSLAGRTIDGGDVTTGTSAGDGTVLDGGVAT